MMITVFSLVLGGVSLIALFAATVAWRKRDAPGGFALTLTFVGVAIWCFFSGMETTSLDAYHRYLWNAISYIGLCNVPPLFLVFALQYSDSTLPLTPWTVSVFWSIPIATIVLAFTNSLHHLIWIGFTMGPVPSTNTVVYHHGVWYFIATFWLLALSLIASFHLVRVAFRAAALYVTQAVILLISVIVPWIGLLLFVLPNGPVPGLDTTSLGFAVSAILIMTAFNRLRFLDLIPRARENLVERMPEGFVVVDASNRIVDINQAACRHLGIDTSPVGKSVDDVVPALNGLPGEANDAPTVAMISRQGGRVSLEVSTSYLGGRKRATPTARVLLIRDVTERRRAEEERERLVADLQSALADVKKLSGLLPICASCKKIRDDKGYWHQVEDFVEKHAEVQFSHGLCPDCMRKLYVDGG